MIGHNRPKTILYGAGSASVNRFSYINLEFDVTAVSDRDEGKAEWIERVWGRPYVKPAAIPECEFDCILIASTFENEIRRYLIQELKIPREKIRSATMECELWKKKGFHSFGELNPDKVFYVIQRGTNSYGNGLMANFLVTVIAMRYALQQGYIPIVDMQNYYNINMELYDLGKVNTWEQYFKQPAGDITLEEVYKSKYVVYSDLGMDCVKVRQPDLYFWEDMVQSREINDYYHDLYKRYLGLAPGIEERLGEEFDKLFGKCREEEIAGICIRGTDYTKSKPFLHYMQPALEQAGDKAEEFLEKHPIQYLYVTSDEKKTVEYFEKRFPGKVRFMEHPYFDSFHTSDADTLSEIHFDRKNDPYLRGLEYLISVLLLTRCAYLIAGRCSASHAAMMINNHYKDKFIFDIGRYGIDDDCYLWAPGGGPYYIGGAKDETINMGDGRRC